MCAGLWGCRSQSPPTVVTHTTLESDSIMHLMASLLAGSRQERRVDSIILTERTHERVILSETGDTLRHATRTEISREQYMALERECRELRMQIDSLRKTSCRVDSVPVPYEVKVPVPVERELTAWEKTRLRTWWPLAVALTVALLYVFRSPLKRVLRKVI